MSVRVDFSKDGVVGSKASTWKEDPHGPNAKSIGEDFHEDPSLAEIDASQIRVVRPERRIDTAQVWPRCLEILRKSIDPQIVQAWIEPLVVSDIELVSSPSDSLTDITKPSITEISLTLLAPNKFSADHIQETYGPQITNALGDTVGASRIQLRFRVGETRRETPKGFTRVGDTDAVRRARTSSKPATKDFPGTQLNPKYNFSNFVVGSCNQFAHAVSLQVSENIGSLYNPLFIYGGVGLGKTHLVNAIGNASVRRGKNVLMVSSEAFVNELITALRSNKMPQFKTRFRSLDLLIIDDVQFLIGKERTQEEFFHTFNELYQQHRQIIITSDKTPQELTGLEERLRTRFASGISADMQAPDFETRIAIVSKKAEGLGVAVPFPVAELLAERVESNVRELEGALNRVIALSSLRNVPVSLEVAEHAVRDCLPTRRADVSIESIQKQVGERYSVSLSDLLGKRRTQNIAFARQVAMYICRRLTACSFPEIGALFGGRDHSTVIHAVKVIEEKMQNDFSFKRDIEQLSKKVIA